MSRFELASCGTLFLGNVQALEASAQKRLLGVLELGVATPLRGDNEPYAVSARVIAGATGDLTRLVREGRFRQDLYERLAATIITVPSAPAGS